MLSKSIRFKTFSPPCILVLSPNSTMQLTFECRASACSIPSDNSNKLLLENFRSHLIILLLLKKIRHARNTNAIGKSHVQYWFLTPINLIFRTAITKMRLQG